MPEVWGSRFRSITSTPGRCRHWWSGSMPNRVAFPYWSTTTAVALTPGWMRSEMMLEHFGVTEANWRDGAATDPHFAAISESPRFVGRAVAALAADPDVHRRNGGSFSAGGLARDYGFPDVDGSRPDCWRYLVEVQEAGQPADPTGFR